MFYNWCMYVSSLLLLVVYNANLCMYPTSLCFMPQCQRTTSPRASSNAICYALIILERKKVSVAILKFRKVFNLNSTVRAVMLFTTILSTYHQIILSDILFRLVERKDSKVLIYWHIFIIVTQYVEKIILGYK